MRDFINFFNKHTATNLIEPNVTLNEYFFNKINKDN